MTDPDELLALLDEAAANAPDVAVELDSARGRTWSRAGVPFAVLGETGVELRIGATIADAAVRTPDTAHSDRGLDWVTFAPAELDDHGLDRLKAWFAAAHRRAAPGG